MKKMKKINKQLRSNLITYGIVVVAYIIVTLCMQAGMISSLLQGLLVPLCVYVILAISLNLTVGILGELSLGHAGFMCAGAFSGALFSKITADIIQPAGLRFFLALLVGTAVAALFGFLIGIPVLRLKGDYLAIVTLAFGEIIKNVVNVVFLGRDSAGFHVSTKDSMSLGLESGGQVLIKGPQGITGTPNDSTFLIGIILILVTLFIVINLINSRTGRAIMAIRDNRIAAESVGGTAGVLYAHNLSTLIALPKNFGYNMSIMILVFVVLGGIGNIRGSIIAAVVLTLLPELLRSLNDYRMLIYAVVLIATMIFTSSQGGQEIQERVKAFFKRGKKAEEGK